MAHEPQQQPDSEFDPDAMEHREEESAESDSPPQESRAARLSGAVNGSELIGQTLAGRYRFDALLGEGTFARVFRVYDLNRRVHLAAKVLRSDIAQEPMFMERFKREARMLERLQHPNIVRYYDIVESGDLVFILTDYIAGHTLQSVIRQQDGPMDPQESLNYLAPLAAALHFAHNEGVVHRDLKPANILIDENGGLYVTDFGIARFLTDASTLTMDTTSTLGTPHYMSPEQIMVGEVGPTTDVYALGVLLFQMFTGQLPFTGDLDTTYGSTAAVRIAYEHLHVQPPRLTQFNAALSEEVEDVVLKCLSKDPSQRYQSVSDLYDALADAVGTPPVSLDAVVGGGAEPEKADPVAERVPTGIGGASRIASQEDVADYVVEGYPDEAVEEDDEDIDHLAWGDDWRTYKKRKRELKRDARKAKRSGQISEAEYAEMNEKEREKKRESEEKSDEKSQEKGTDVNVEKGDFFVDLAADDRLSQFTWGGMVLWAGIVFFLSGYGATATLFQNEWSWIFGGAGAMLLGEVGMRLVLPQYRAKPGSRLVMGVIFLMIGLGINFSFSMLWPLILIAIGASLLINQFFD